MKIPKFRMGWKARTSLLFLLAALIYLVAPIDILPFTIFDDVAIIVIAIVFWFLMVIVESKEGGEKHEG